MGHQAQPDPSTGQVLQYTGGQWQGTDNLVSALARTDSLQAFQDNLLDDTAQPWTAGAYQPDEVVSHNGSLYMAREAVVPGDVPGTSPKWVPLTLESLWHKADLVTTWPL